MKTSLEVEEPQNCRLELLGRRLLLGPSLMAWGKCIDPADPCRAARNKY